MHARMLRPLAALALGAISIASLPSASRAQQPARYKPPLLVAQGSPKAPILGAGSVTLTIFVRKSGAPGAVKIAKSSNHGDDAAALEIAKNSTFRPGLSDDRPVDAFYTMQLTFGPSAAVIDSGRYSSQVARANALLRANKFAAARAALQSYLAGHPRDRDARMLLAVADTYLNDVQAAVVEFDSAGPIPDRFKIIAFKAYSDAAVESLEAKNSDRAIQLSTKALALQQNVNVLYVRGTASANAQHYAPAIDDLERAKALAAAEHADSQTVNAIDASLVDAYLSGGQIDRGIVLAAALKRRDPSNTRIDETLLAYYNQQSIAALQAGKRDDAVADLENGARMIPSHAVALYVQATNILSGGLSPDWKRVKAEADKALAINPNDASSNYVAGIALANQNDVSGAIVYLQKARAGAGSDASLSAQIDSALKSLGARK